MVFESNLNKRTTAIFVQKKIVSLKSKDFLSFFRNTKKINTPLYALYIKSNTLNQARLGIIIKKKHIKTAVNRNKIKRIVREQFRLRLTQLIGYDLVVFVNKFKDKEVIDFFRSDLEKQWPRLETYIK